ncbi:MAG: hypothetical protein II888_00030 [Clostridia bacterium]|nr:hypothetical protein [Clostridia bacterium]
MKFIAWLLSLLFAFNLGAGTVGTREETDDELKNKVQEHIDVIVDEGAAIVDDVTESIRNDERVKEAEEFVQDVKDVAEETLEDLNKVVEDTKERVEEKFGAPEEAEAPEAGEPTLPPEVTPEVMPEVTPDPADEDPING